MKRLTKAFCILLAAAMLLSLAACGKSGGKAETTPTPDTVYVSEFKTFPGTYQGGEGYFNIQIIDDSGFIGTANEVVSQREPAEGEIAEYEGQFNIEEPRLYRMDFDGNLTKLAYEPMKPSVEREDAEASTWINSLLKTDDGFLAIEEVYVSWNTAPKSVERWSDEWYNYTQSQDEYYIRRLDENGRELSCAKMDLDAARRDEEYFSPYRVVLLPDGSLLTSGEAALYAFDSGDGSFLYRIDSDFTSIVNMFRCADGRILVSGYRETLREWKLELRELDTAKRKLGATFPAEGDLYNAIPGTGPYLLFYTDGNNFYGYDEAKKEPVKLFNWINVDVLSDELDSYTVLPDGSVIGLMTEWDKNYENATRTLVTVHEVPYSTVPEKTVLTLATDGLDWNVRRELVRFNRMSDTTRIEILDYSEYDNYETDFDENGVGELGGMTKLRTEILSGKMPDILDLSGMPTRQLAAKGLLMDLYPLLDADPELSREDIFPNVLKALETDGKLTSVSSGFYIETCVGASKVVGDTPGWTYRELNAALATMPEGCSVFGVYTTRETILQTMLQLDLGRFVDWNTGKVSFDSKEFIDLLNFVNEFPASFDWENYEWSEEDEDYTRIREGRQLLLSGGLSSLSDIASYESIFGGADSFTFIGYPTAEGVGNLLRIDSGYAISRDCKDPQAAWQFLRVLLTEKYEEERGYNFPANIHVFEKQKKDAMTPTYQRDANGMIQLDPETGEKLMEVKGWGVDLNTYEGIPIYFYTEEQIARVEEVIAATDRVPDNNVPILQIVREQTQPFFAGQRSAEEVVKYVQSKANIYVNEQR